MRYHSGSIRLEVEVRRTHELALTCRRLSETSAGKVPHSMSTATAFQRTPLVISAGTLVAGPVNAAFRAGDPGSLLHSYLVLVRQLRGQQRESTITLRSADISALATHLGSSEERVLDDLLDRMGATRAQRRALAAMFAVGALTIVATGSIALELSSSGVAAEGRIGDIAAVEVVQPNPPVTMGVQASTVRTEPLVETRAASLEPELAIAGAGADWDVVVAVHLLKQSLADVPSDESIPPAVAGEGEGVGVADDGSIVAVGLPPAPPPTVP